jgi:hypothetical protein
MLTLNNFEKNIQAVILQRGRQYFEDDTVQDLEEEKQGIWTASVSGSADYAVGVVLSGQNIESFACDCPYDGGPVCKHVVAVLYALKGTKPPKKKAAKTKQMGFEDLLLKIDLEELRDFVRDYKKESRDFGDKFMLFFADKDPQMDIAAKYEGLVRQIVRRHSSRGFMDYRQTFAFSSEIRLVLNAADKAINQNNYLAAFSIAQVLCQEIMKLLESSDDSAGNIGGVLSSSISIFEKLAIVPTISPELLEVLFDFLDKELLNRIWFNYGDFGYELLGISEIIAVRIAPDRFLQLIDTLIKTHTGSYDDYEQNTFKKLKISFLNRLGRAQEAEALIVENMEIVEVRRDVVNKAIETQDFTRAKQLVAEGISIAEVKKHPGTVHQWEEIQLNIAYLEKDLTTVRRLTKKFAFHQGLNQKYYKAWKDAYPPSEWPDVIERHVQSIIQNETTRPRQHSWDILANSLYQRLYNIYILECQWERLLKLVPKSPDEGILDTIHPHLAKRFPKEMLALYLPLLEKMGENASSRPAYQELAELMKKVRQDIEGSHAAIDEMAQRLIQKYPRRPAMIEELGKVLKRH